jgi:hypothetical protein
MADGRPCRSNPATRIAENCEATRAMLLNTGPPVDFSVEMAPGDHAEQQGYLRLRGLPVNSLSNTLMVVKLQFPDGAFPAGWAASRSA